MHAKFTYHSQWEVLRALGEAWGWLQTHGLISWNPEKDEPTAFVVSRRGEQLLKAGLPWLRAVARLDIGLTPVLEHKARPLFLRGDFETAAFIAMKEVEVQVRRRGGFS